MNPLIVYFLLIMKFGFGGFAYYSWVSRYETSELLIFIEYFASLCILPLFKLHKNVMWWVLLLTPFNRWGTWGLLKLSGFPKISQLVRSIARIWAQVCMTSKFHLCLPCILLPWGIIFNGRFNLKYLRAPCAIKSTQF